MARELPSAAGNAARLAYAQARAAGVALEPLLKKAGLTVHQIEDDRVRLKVRDQIRFLNIAAGALEDDYLGFHLAQLFELRQVGSLYYVLASSDTLIEALQRAARYSSIVNDDIVLKSLDGGRVGISLRYVGVSRHLDRHQIEFWVTAIVRTQGNRVNKSCGDEACEEVVVPSGDFAFEAQGVLARRFSDEVVGHVLEGGEIGGGVIGADAAFVVAEDHVHDPVQAVLDCPMAADDRPELAGQPHQGGDVKARLALDFVADFAGALDHDDAFNPGQSWRS